MSEESKFATPVQPTTQEAPTLRQGPDKTLSERQLMRRQISTYRRFLITLAVFSGISCALNLYGYLQIKNLQVLIATVVILLSSLLILYIYRLIKQEKYTLSGILAEVWLCIIFCINELTWKGLTPYNLIGGLLIILLVGSLILPRRRYIWIITAILYTLSLFLVNRYTTLPRYDISAIPILLPSSVFTTLLLTLVLCILLLLIIQKRSIRTRLLIASIFIVLLSSIAIGAVSSYMNAQNSQQRLISQLNSVASLKVSEIDTWLNSLYNDLRLVMPPADQIESIALLINKASSVVSAQYREAYDREKRRFEKIVAQGGLFEEIFIIDPDGLVTLSTDSSQVGSNISSRPYFTPGLQDLYITPPYLDPSLNRLTVVAAAPIKDKNGHTLGVLAGRAILSTLSNIMVERTGLGSTGETYLVNSKHRLISKSLYPEYPVYDSYLFSEAINKSIEKGVSGSGVYTGYRGVPVIGVYHWLPEIESVLVAEQNRSEALLNTFQSLLISTGVTLGAIFIAVMAALFTTRRITTPLANLAKTVEQISNGELQIIAKVDQEDEIGALARSFNSMTAQLRSMVDSLEQRVAQRTQELERRSVQLQVAAEVARDASTVREMNQLLSRAVDLIRERFGFYHAGIFILDDRREYAVLKAATGDAGQEMLKRGHKLKVGETGIVGFVTQTGQSRIAHDVSSDAVHYKNPFLPLTRSEIALPFKTGDRIIGALDVQSTKENAFDDDSVKVLQTLADQLAVAIESARMFREMEQTLAELELAYSNFTRETWQKLKEQGGVKPGYRYSGLDIEPLTEYLQEYPEVSEALEQGRSIITKPSSTPDNEDGKDEEKTTSLAVPMKIRGQVIGVLNLRLKGTQPSSDVVMVFEEIANRLALAMDNARLYSDTQHRAERERILSEITSKVRSSTNVDHILQTAIQEVADKLHITKGSILLRGGNGGQADEGN